MKKTFFYIFIFLFIFSFFLKALLENKGYSDFSVNLVFVLTIILSFINLYIADKSKQIHNNFHLIKNEIKSNITWINKKDLIKSFIFSVFVILTFLVFFYFYDIILLKYL